MTVWLHRAYCAGVLAFLLVPIAAIVPLSFSSGSFLTYPLPGLSLRWYDEVFNGPKWLGALSNSLRVGLAATGSAPLRAWVCPQSEQMSTSSPSASTTFWVHSPARRVRPHSAQTAWPDSSLPRPKMRPNIVTPVCAKPLGAGKVLQEGT